MKRFRQTIATLERTWAAEARNAPFYPFVTWTAEGPRLGAATVLARKGAPEEARLLALLSVAYGFPVPAKVLKHLAWAEAEFDRGDFAKSAMHVALTGISAFAGREGARRLHIAAGILDEGFLTPTAVLKACGLDGGEVETLANITKTSRAFLRATRTEASGRPTVSLPRRTAPLAGKMGATTTWL
ncbi:hypothetical protein [Roseiarcus fermentans]|uniref:hypothetical protein n=1 Tax=Roseiarcus fermentans TaxID=1473586 RepID=UPI000DEA622A|nr:hypothetical protein [Roseiarcus fermentans]